MKVRFLLIGVVVLFVACVLTVPSYAKIAAVGAWMLDEGSGNIAKDSSGNKNDGTLKDAPKWAGGHSGNALEFSGAAGYADCGNAASLNITKSLTAMAWVKPNEVSRWQRFVSRGEYTTGWLVGITAAGKSDLTITDASGALMTHYGKTTLEIGKVSYCSSFRFRC